MLVIKKADRIHSRVFNSEKSFQTQFSNIYYSSLDPNFCQGHLPQEGNENEQPEAEDRMQGVGKNVFLLTAAFFITSIGAIHGPITLRVLFPEANIIATLKSPVVTWNA